MSPARDSAISTRKTTWTWLDDDGAPTETTYPVTIVVLCESGGYAVRAYRGEQMIADEVIRGRNARARALRFSATGWAEFEALRETRATA